MNDRQDPNGRQNDKSLSGAALKVVGFVVFVIAIYYSSQYASYAFFSTFG